MNAPMIRPGWEAELHLAYQLRAGKTRLTSSKRRGPLAVQRSFYPERDLCHTYLLHPPGGVVGGDQLDIDLSVATQAAVLVTTPGATKFYRSTGSTSKLTQKLKIAAGASLEWMPLENIFFPGTRADITTEIHLDASAQFIGWEINCLGRPANQERFETGSIRSRLKLYRDQKPVLFERFETDGLSLVDSPMGMRGRSAQAMLIATLDDSNIFEAVQDYIELNRDDFLAGVTMVDRVLIMRVIGDQSQVILKHFAAIWALVRPVLLDRPSCPPRIWAT